MKFFITGHLKQRYIERVLNNKETNNLCTDILKDCSASKNISSHVSNDNPRWLLYLMEKYKKRGIQILKKDDLYFIAYKREGTNDLYDVVTCYYGDETYNTFKKSSMKRSDIFLKIKQLKIS